MEVRLMKNWIECFCVCLSLSFVALLATPTVADSPPQFNVIESTLIAPQFNVEPDAEAKSLFAFASYATANLNDAPVCTSREACAAASGSACNQQQQASYGSGGPVRRLFQGRLFQGRLRGLLSRLRPRNLFGGGCGG